MSLNGNQRKKVYGIRIEIMKEQPQRFNSLEEATKEMILSDFDGVLEYKLQYVKGAWEVKRRLITANAIGKSHWTVL